MYISKQTAPPEFMQRYEAIKSGREKLDTVAKLKDFWLFAVEQGWKSYDMREYVAELTCNATLSSTVTAFKDWQRSYELELWNVYDYFEADQSLNGEPGTFRNGMTAEEFADEAWRFVAHLVTEIDPSKYD